MKECCICYSTLYLYEVIFIKLIDLSHKLYNDILVYSGDSAFKLYQERFLDIDSFNGYRLETGLHVGTHIDCASHLTDVSIKINDISIDKFMGNGVLIDARGKNTITADDIDSIQIERDSIVLILSGTDKYFGQERYYKDFPLLTVDAAELLISHGIKMLGIDWFSPDKFPFETHKLLFRNDILILENLTNLEQLIDVDKFVVTAFPLNIPAEASLVRAVAAIH